MYFFGFMLFSLLFRANAGQNINETSVVSDKDIKYRLPNNTEPVRYDIKIVTNIHENDFKFSGLVKIYLRVLESSDKITLHARQLTIETIKLTDSHGNSVELKNYKQDSVTDFLKISTEKVLLENERYTLTISYSGTLRTDQLGFHRLSYVNSKGETK